MKEKDQFEEYINKLNETDYEMTQERFDMWLELFDRLGQIVEDCVLADFIRTKPKTLKKIENKIERKKENEEI
jgi:hypothetical protein